MSDHDHRQKTFWLIAVPHSKKDPTADIFSELKRAIAQKGDFLEEANLFNIPGAKSGVDDTPGLIVGNIDSLFALSDDLRKLDNHVESTIRKIAAPETYERIEGEPETELQVKGSKQFIFFL